jgi:Flp pilus assembly protein TadD
MGAAMLYRGLFFAGLAVYGALFTAGAVRAARSGHLPTLQGFAPHLRAKEMGRSGDHAGRVRELTTATLVDPGDLPAFGELAGILSATGDYDGEFATYQRALAHHPSSPAVRRDLGLAFLRRAQPAEAFAHLARATQLDPRDALALAGLGDALRALGRPADAVPVYEKALALAPRNAAIHNKAGIAYATVGNVARAREEFQAAAHIDPADALAPHNLKLLPPEKPQP